MLWNFIHVQRKKLKTLNIFVTCKFFVIISNFLILNMKIYFGNFENKKSKFKIQIKSFIDAVSIIIEKKNFILKLLKIKKKKAIKL